MLVTSAAICKILNLLFVLTWYFIVVRRFAIVSFIPLSIGSSGSTIIFPSCLVTLNFGGNKIAMKIIDYDEDKE